MRTSVWIALTLGIGATAIAIGWSFFRLSDDAILRVAESKLNAGSLFSYDGVVAYKSNKEPFEIQMRVKGIADRSQKKMPSSSGTIIGKLTRPEQSFDFSAAFRRLPEASFIRFEHLPSLGMINLSDALRVWFKIPASTSTPPAETHPSLEPPLKADRLITSYKRQRNELISGVRTYHYTVDLSKENVKRKLFPIIFLDSIAAPDRARAWDAFFSNLEVRRADIWVNAGTLALARVHVIGQWSDSTANLSASFNVWLDALQPKKNSAITAPLTTQPISLLLDPLIRRASALVPFPDVVGERLSPSELKRFEIDTDRDGLTDLMEQFYGSDPLNPDTDGDGHPDGEEVNKGYDPLGSGRLAE